MNTRTRTASLPPGNFAGLDPAWSRLVEAVDDSGVKRTWHVLDTGTQTSGKSLRGTVLCVHGNPNWSYMWRGLAQTLTDWRVVAVDALNMGYSERIGGSRRLGDHICDLVAVTNALEVEGPVVTVAHDWGGAISMGWAQQNLEQLAGVVLMNTGVARPASTPVPPLISIARSTLKATCETTPTFLHGALRMARPQLDRDVYRGYAAPYRSAAMRTGIRDFVEDIPVLENHPTHKTLASVAQGLEQLSDTPTLLLWGAKDIVFSDAFLHDLMQRLPHADVHRYPDAGHQIMEDTDAAEVIRTWFSATFDEPDRPVKPDNVFPRQQDQGPRIWAAIEARRGDPTVAIVEMEPKDSGSVARSISFGELDRQVHALARGLTAMGIKTGDRLATLVSPGIDLTVLVYACLRAGITFVAPDAALGLKGLKRALKSARPDYVVGDWRGLTLAKSLRLPATRLSVEPLPAPLAKAVQAVGSMQELISSSDNEIVLPEPLPTDPAAIVFTSGSTGPSKGVIYTHQQIEAQRDAVTQAFSIQPNDRLVVAFAPFALLAPAVGVPAAIPEMNVTAPGKLRAQALAHAAKAMDATIIFASPAVLANVAATATEVDDVGRHTFTKIHSVVTAGAPVSPQLLAAAQPIFPDATLYTPYGMTELLPVTIASDDEITKTGSDSGVCVGLPLPQIDYAIRPIGAPSGSRPAPVEVGELGEVWLQSNHMCAGYDRLWAQQYHAFADGWHRTGDVGHVDAHGRLWIEGRVDHLIHAPSGVLAPVRIELQAESVDGVDLAAAVGIGPRGTQQLAVVVAGTNLGSDVVADGPVTAAVRAAVSGDVAAVLVAPKMPVDRRHNSKIDRTRVQTWAAAVLGGATRSRI